MSERITLEQLKGMDNEQLMHHWQRGGFPFEGAVGCYTCLTGHAIGCCGHIKHGEISRQVRALGSIGPRADDMPFVRAHLEELYALRLFYDHLYPQPATEPAPQEEAQSEQTQARR